MHPFICTTCGVQYEPSDTPPPTCPICTDDRQYVNPSGQSWTTLPDLNKQHKNCIEAITPEIYAVYTTPSFAIGQRAHLIISPGGNVLWDCITHLDEATIATLNQLGGVKAIALSHPHYFSAIVEWSKAFGDVPVYINEQDERWLGRRSAAIRLWNGELPLWDNIKLITCGGHFPGASVLYNPRKGGSLFTGDTLQVSPDLASVSFMHSYPNLIPLRKKEVQRIQQAIAHIPYDSIYGAFGRYICRNAMEATERSARRYLQIFE